MTDLKPNPSTDLLDSMLREGDAGDPWGTAMGIGFALCDRLHHVYREATPEGLGYRPASVWTWEPETAEDHLLAELDPEVDDLYAAAEALDTYLDVLKAAGRDY